MVNQAKVMSDKLWSSRILKKNAGLDHLDLWREGDLKILIHETVYYGEEMIHTTCYQPIKN